jgi:hypothetical protein
VSRGLGKMQRRVLVALVTPCESCGRTEERPWLGRLAEMVVADQPLCVDCGPRPEYSVSTYRSVSRAVIGLEQRGLLSSKTQRGSWDHELDRTCWGYTHEKTVWLSNDALSVDWLALMQASLHLNRLAHEWSTDIELDDGCSSHLVFAALRVGLVILAGGDLSVDWCPYVEASQHLEEAAA